MSKTTGYEWLVHHPSKPYGGGNMFKLRNSVVVAGQ